MFLSLFYHTVTVYTVQYIPLTFKIDIITKSERGDFLLELVPSADLIIKKNHKSKVQGPQSETCLFDLGIMACSVEKDYIFHIVKLFTES